MDITIIPGTYVVAVSGGVDSMALLHILQARGGIKLTVAHFDHGIRSDSRQDRQLVQQVASSYGLPFVYAKGLLGPNASEAEARKVRYEFLHKVRLASGAQAIMTAHHKDDVMETAIINVARGTGRKGLTSLQSTDVITRPLLAVTKQQLLQYAHQHNLQWREDSTNSDPAYLRNRVRQLVAARFGETDKAKLHNILAAQQQVNGELDALLVEQLQYHAKGPQLERQWFINLPYDVALEVMAEWLRSNSVRSFDAKTLERLTHAAKTQRIGHRLPVQKGLFLRIDRDFLALQTG